METSDNGYKTQNKSSLGVLAFIVGVVGLIFFAVPGFLELKQGKKKEITTEASKKGKKKEIREVGKDIKTIGILLITIGFTVLSGIIAYSIVTKRKQGQSTENAGLPENERTHHPQIDDQQSIILRQSTEKLLKNIHKARNDANEQLALGAITGSVGIVTLAILLILNFDDQQPTSIRLISRASILIFFEGLSLFFLRSYNKQLEAEKFYKNEITNLEQKEMAIELLRESNQFTTNQEQQGLRKIIVEELMKSERNFILKKGENAANIQPSNTSNAQLEDIQKKIKELNDIITQLKGANKS